MVVRFEPSDPGDKPAVSGGSTSWSNTGSSDLARVTSFEQARTKRASGRSRSDVGSGSGLSSANVRQREPANDASSRSNASLSDADGELAPVASVTGDVLAPARDRILSQLRRRGLSEAEVLRAAMNEGVSAHQANEILEQVRSWGYVDDRAFAEQLMAKAQERKGQGREAVRRVLSERLIRSDIVSELLDEVDDDDELARATQIAERRAGQLRSLSHEVAHRRLSGYLARRGYSGVVVRQATDSALGDGRSSRVLFTPS